MAAALVVLAISPAAEPSAKANVVFLSVDTLRADRLGCYGYPLPTSPNLDRFAEGALLFEDAVCEVPLTMPSFGSMLTSRYPRMTGTTRNGLRMPKEVPTVVEQFEAAGYATFCVQSNWTLKARLSGLSRGFDVYDDGFYQKRWGVAKAERPGDRVTRLALELLAQQRPDRPFFAWIHYSEPHAPYKMHEGFNPGGRDLRELGNIEKTRARYDSEVAFVDTEIGRLLEALPANTKVLFVSDHGESLHEHGYLGHGRRIYQTGLHIALMIRAEGVSPGRTAAPVRGVDVGPTLLGLAGLPRVKGMLGIDLLEGRVPTPRTRVIETYGGAVPPLPGVKAAMAHAGPIWQGVLLDGWKLILNEKQGQLYHLPADPGELKDLSGEEPERVAELWALVKEWDAATEHVALDLDNLDDEDIQALRSLGYLE